jgi:hypothetical protein
MRVGDFSVEVVATDGAVREVESGHVLARPGQVYALRLRNHGPLRCVADIAIDGRTVTGDGLVINAWSSVDLERPIHASERGRFTVIAEGDERVFGPDGGRDNPDLGLIEARFRRELPNAQRRHMLPEPTIPQPIVTMPLPPRPPTSPDRGPYPSRPYSPPEWSADGFDGETTGDQSSLGISRFDFSALMTPQTSIDVPAAPKQMPGAPGAIERAAGTGLTGASNQEFVPVHVGPLESEATVIRLRLVIGSDDALDSARPLPGAEAAPARPAARP